MQARGQSPEGASKAKAPNTERKSDGGALGEDRYDYSNHPAAGNDNEKFNVGPGANEMGGGSTSPSGKQTGDRPRRQPPAPRSKEGTGLPAGLRPRLQASITELRRKASTLSVQLPELSNPPVPDELITLVRDVAKVQLLQPYLRGRDLDLNRALKAMPNEGPLQSLVDELQTAVDDANRDLDNARKTVVALFRSTRTTLPQVHARHPQGAITAARPEILRTIIRDVYEAVARDALTLPTLPMPASESLTELATDASELAERLSAATEPAELTFMLPASAVSVADRMLATTVSAKQAHGFVVGDHARTTLIHRCRVQHPVVEIADLIRACPVGEAAPSHNQDSAADDPVLVRHQILVPQNTRLTFRDSSITRGNNARGRHDVQNTIRDCPVGAQKLLDYPAVREAVHVLAAAPDDAEAAKAHHDLVKQIRAIAATDAPGDWIDDFDDLAADAYPGTVSGWFGSISIVHLAGGAIGTENTAKLTELYTVTRPIIR